MRRKRQSSAARTLPCGIQWDDIADPREISSAIQRSLDTPENRDILQIAEDSKSTFHETRGISWNSYERPPGNHERPPGNHERPPGNHERPPGNHERPPGNHERPPGNYERPPGNYERPPSNHERPPGNYERPPGNHERPPSNHERPPGNYERPPGNHERLPSNHERPPGNHERLPNINYRLSDNHERPTGNYERPTRNYEKLPGNYERPGNHEILFYKSNRNSSNVRETQQNTSMTDSHRPENSANRIFYGDQQRLEVSRKIHQSDSYNQSALLADSSKTHHDSQVNRISHDNSVTHVSQFSDQRREYPHHIMHNNNRIFENGHQNRPVEQEMRQNVSDNRIFRDSHQTWQNDSNTEIPIDRAGILLNTQDTHPDSYSASTSQDTRRISRNSRRERWSRHSKAPVTQVSRSSQEQYCPHTVR